MKIPLILLLLFSHQSLSQTVPRPEFRIISPQFMCNVKSANTSIEAPPEQITIRFQPREGMRLTYLVRVYFEFIDGWKSQWRTISLWRSVRMLEKRIRNTSETITLNNQIYIDQKELTPGVAYTFNIAARDSNGGLSEEENVTVLFRGDSVSKNSARDTSLLLIGSVYIYSHLPLLIQANLIFCDPTNDYVFKWQMPVLENEQQEWLKTPGKTFYLPPNTLKPRQNDEIQVQVVNSNRTLMYTQKSMKLHVLNKEFYALLIPRNLSIGINHKITYKLSISELDVDQYSLEISWECENLRNNTNCTNFQESFSPKQEVSFLEQGYYRVSAIITYQEFTQNLTSFVIVDPRVIASVQFPDIKPEPLVSWRALRIPTVVNNVIPNCLLQWVTVNVTEDSSYGFIDESFLTTKLIPDLEENFLSDIVEISNATFSEDFPLAVPEKSDNFDGIEPQKIYIFRLLITCPEPINEWDSESQGNVTSFADLIINSKQPPQARPMEVIPEEGIALKTLFTIFTGTAVDTPEDYPMRYLFQYQVGPLVVDLEEYYESMEIVTELPYSENPIRIFYRVCDTENACSRTEGPAVRVNLTNDFSKEEFNFKLDKIKSMFYRTEYSNMFSTSASCILTFRELPDKTFYQILKTELIQSIQKEIDRLQTIDAEDIFVSQLKIMSFVKYGKRLTELLGDRNVKLKERLLNLLNSIPQERSDDFDAMEENNLIMKRSISRVDIEIRDLSQDDKIQKGILDIELREAILNSYNFTSNSQKISLLKNFTQHLREFIGDILCPSLQLSSDYNFASVNFSLEIFRGNAFQVKVKNLSLPLSSWKVKKRNGYVVLRNIYQTSPNREYCASRIAYSSDFMTGDHGKLFDVTLFEIDSELNSAIMMETNEDNEKFSIVSLQFESEGSFEDAKCVIWNGDSWADDNCNAVLITSSSIECQCSTLGFVKAISNSRFDYEEVYDNLTTESTTEYSGVTKQSETIVNDPPIDFMIFDKIDETETLVITSDIKKKANSVSDIFTFSPIVNNAIEEIVTVTTTIQRNASETPDDHGETVRETSFSTLIGFIVVGVFCLIIILIVTLNLYFIRKKNKLKHLQEMQIMSTEARVQSEEIKYARFYDEQMLSGN
ncbi:uncharacterized protein LOC132264870 [Phlebotomus argentipes]|uniref:uncharacterized protein LOC132264870 n=1 Tax=Phlebotomus argentipes TaxID=94469 RepID=UPI002893762F|nr:uncharacterized protein LOC132264870 [Phlebotomus argentipes]